MSTELIRFAYEGSTVRTVVIDGEPEWVAADVCRVLEHSNASAAVAGLDDDERGLRNVETPSGAQQMVTVTEAGLYTLIIRSRKAEAKRFRRWITHEVLPTIRKTGGYGQSVERLTPLEYARQLVAAEERVEAERERAESERSARVEAEQHARELEAPAPAWSHMAESTGDYGVADAAKVLSRDPAISIGRDRLFSFMAAEGWIFRDRGTSSWKARQTQVDIGRLVKKLGTPYLHEPTRQMRLPAPTIRITAKGLAELHKRLGGTGQLPLMAVTA